MNYGRLALLGMLGLVTACGGGGGGGGTTPVDGGSATGVYSLAATQSTASAMLMQLQQQGVANRAWVSGVVSYAQPAQFAELYLQSNLRPSSVFQYVLDAEPSAMADLLTLMNLRGSQGYAYRGSNIFGTAPYSVFVKDSVKSSTYSYESLSAAVNSSPTNLLAQLNTQGARGFRWLGASATSAAPSTFSNLYAKESAGPSTYTYTAISLGSSYAPANQADMLSSLHQGAAGGAHYFGAYVAGSQYLMIFERPSGSTAAIEYSAATVPSGESLDAMLQTINAAAAQGRFHIGDMVTMDGQFHHVFVKGNVFQHPLSGVVFP